MLSAPSPARGLRGLPALGRAACLRLSSLLCLLPAHAAAWEDPGLAAEPEPLIASSRLWVGLRGGFSRSAGERQRRFGILELGIGFEALTEAAPVGISAPGASESRLASEAEGESAGFPGAAAAPGKSEAPGPPPTQELTFAAESSRCLQAGSCPDPWSRRLSPGLARAAVAAALRVLGSGGELRRLDSMAARSRLAASLPEMRLGAGTSQDESLRLAPTLADPARFTRDGGRDLWFEARLTWRLDTALFSRDEIAIERLKAGHRELRARATREVLEALLDWQRAGVALRTEHLLPEERDAARVRELGAVARLDVATGGWFSRYLERRRGAPARSAVP